MSCNHPNFEAITHVWNGKEKRPAPVNYEDLTPTQKALYNNTEAIYFNMVKGYTTIPVCIEPRANDMLDFFIEHLIVTEPSAVRDFWSKASGLQIRNRLTQNAKKYFWKFNVGGQIMFGPADGYRINRPKGVVVRTTNDFRPQEMRQRPSSRKPAARRPSARKPAARRVSSRTSSRRPSSRKPAARRVRYY